MTAPAADTAAHTPVLACDPAGIRIEPSLVGHPLQFPLIHVPASIEPALAEAAAHLRAGRTVAFPTETVYGLGAHSLDSAAVKRVYAIKRRPADNPLIIHVASLSMLHRLLPATYALSPLYSALIDAFWPGPLTLLFPNPNPPPPPAPQTNAIRMPNHPLALALIRQADLPVSAPSANSSGRPSPTRAEHVAHDLDGAEGLGCILDGGPCGVGVESTVVDGLGWKQGGGGVVNVLRPGGLGVEDIEKVVALTDLKYDGETKILVHGKPWRKCQHIGKRMDLGNADDKSEVEDKDDSQETTTTVMPVVSRTEATTSSAASGSVTPKHDLLPSTPGMKYRHYSPSVPVHLFLPSNTFARPAVGAPQTAPAAVVAALASATGKAHPRFGLLHYDSSPLWRSLTEVESGAADIEPVSLGPDAASAAQRLFDSMLLLESASVDAIIIEGCTDEGLGLAVMERVGKAVGGGGVSGALGNGQVSTPSSEGRFWVQV